nr:retrovirus-related Pol polyprotein from transposon TNT 1-94 [Tanacetum cinerariifolium]
MATMTENVLTSGAENRPSMLEKGMSNSWKIRILLYIQGNENGEIQNGVEKILLAQAQEAGVILHEDQQDLFAGGLEEFNLDYDDLQLNTTLIFKADHADAFDSDCDEEPTISAIFMARLSPAGSVNEDDVRPTYDSDILSEVRMALRALHPRWRAKVMTIEELKDLTSLSLDELIENLKVQEMIIKKDYEIVKAKGERKSLTLKDKNESSNEEYLTSGSRDQEYAMAVKDFKKFFKKRGRFEKNKREFVRGSWSDSGEEDDKKIKTRHISWLKHLVSDIIKDNKVIASKELVRNLPKPKFDQHFCNACKIKKQAHASDKAKNLVSTTRWLELLHMDLFGPSAVRSYRGNLYILVIVDDYSRTDHGREFDNEVKFGEFCNANGYSQNSKSYIILNKHTMKIKELLTVTFDKTLLPSKTSPLVDDNLDEEEAIKVIENKNLENGIEDETLEIDEVVNVKESRNHPLENVIGNLKQITLRNKLDENDVVSRNKARLVAQGYNQQKGIDYDETYAPVASAFLNGFINEEVYVAQTLRFIDFEKPNHVYKPKKASYGLKQAPKAWPDTMFSVCLCGRFQEDPKTSHLEAVKRIFRYSKDTTHLGL